MYFQILILICLCFFVALLIQQLMLINFSYDLYMESVNDSFIDKLRHVFLILSLSVVSFKYLKKWGKLLVK